MNDNETIKLESLLDLSAKLNSSQDRDFILNMTLLTLMGKLLITRAGILLAEGDYFRIIFKKGNIKSDKIPFFSINKPISASDTSEGSALRAENIFTLIPLQYNDKKMIIALGSRELSSLSESEQKYAILIANIAANALQNAENLQSLKDEKFKAEKQNQLLTTMFEIRKDFSNLHSREQLLKMLSLNLMGQLMISKFAAFSITENNSIANLINRFSAKFSNEEIRTLFEIDTLLCTECNQLDDKYAEILNAHNAKIISPAYVQANKKGVLIVSGKMNGEHFTDDNIKFIEALGGTFFTELENERLFREEIEKKRLESELALALEIQKKLLPKDPPKLHNFDVFGKSIPSRHVGGDYFDFIQLKDGRLLFVVADVSGKGIPASLIMANVQATLRSLTPLSLNLNDLVKSINDLLFENTASDKFVTAFFGIIDDANKELIYINAGHNPPYIVNSESINTLNEGGLLLGIIPNAPDYESGMVSISSGDVIYIFTDGVTESKNTSNEEFGEDKLEKILKNSLDLNSESLINKVFEEVNIFAAGAGQYDDLTAIAIKCK